LKYITIAAVCVLVGLGLIAGVGFYLSPQNELQLADAIVVISGGETDQRIKEGVELYHAGWSDLLIVSGAARDEGVSNAHAMKQIAVSLNVPIDDIIVEEEAQTTVGNAQHIRNIVSDLGMESLILVTSPYHQRRAYLTFRYFLGSDFEMINHSASDSAWRKNGWWKDAWARHLTISELQKLIYLPVWLKTFK